MIRACVTAFIALFCVNTSIRADAEAEKRPRVVIMSDSGTVYKGYVRSERPDVQDLHDMIEQFHRGGVDTFSHCVHSRWQAYYDSKVVEIAGDLTPNEVRPWHYTHYWAWLKTMRRLIEQGHDPPRVLAEACHKRGMRFFALLRMNDTHGIHRHEGHYGSFRRDHPEWMIDGTSSMDYGVPEVREHILSVVKELAGRYEIDGIDFDFMRYPRYFRKEKVKTSASVMTDFLRKVRSILDDAAVARDRRLLLSVRVPQTLDGCINVGLDVRSWVKLGLIDMICPMDFYYSYWDRFMVALDDWVQLVEHTNCGLYPTIHYGAAQGPGGGFNQPWLTAASYRGAAHSYLLKGADGIALYNLWNMNNAAAWVAVKDMHDPVALRAGSSRYHCYLGDLVTINKGDRKSVPFFLPEDPQVPDRNAHLRFFAANLTLDHKFELDINGTPVDLDSLILRRHAVGGFLPRPPLKLPYGHIVLVPLKGTAAKEGPNELGVKLIESNPEIQSLPAYGGTPPTPGGIAVGLLEGLFGYKEFPRLSRPGSMVAGEPGPESQRHVR